MTAPTIFSINEQLRDAVDELSFTTPAFVYNPLRYAWDNHRAYLERAFGKGAKVLLVGMNPGPFGMAQTGVPFGDVSLVRDWVGVSGPVEQPPKTHPKRPVQGFALKRSEGSGKRLWGWARDRFGTPQAFFSQVYIHNYCPLLFLHESGRNLTPVQLTKEEREAITVPCDQTLRELVKLGGYETVVGVGKYAEGRAQEALEGTGVRVSSILHPSPANPLANKDWAGQVEPVLRKLGVQFPG